jgi:hypothetical protein
MFLVSAAAAWWQCSSSLPEATDPGRFEDYARKMYPQYPPQRADLDHWPCIGEGPFVAPFSLKKTNGS